MLQISSFLIAPPSLLLLCMYPLPLRSIVSLCSALAEHCHAMPCDAFALLCKAYLCLCVAVRCPAMLCPCCALSRQADLCNAFALRRRSLRFGVWLCPRITIRCFAMPLPCCSMFPFAMPLLSHAFLGFAMPLHCASKPCLCCAFLSHAIRCYAFAQSKTSANSAALSSKISQRNLPLPLLRHCPSPRSLP